MRNPRHSGESGPIAGRNVHPEGRWVARPLRAPFVLRTFHPCAGGSCGPSAPGIPLRSLRSASPFTLRKGTFAQCPSFRRPPLRHSGESRNPGVVVAGWVRASFVLLARRSRSEFAWHISPVNGETGIIWCQRPRFCKEHACAAIKIDVTQISGDGRICVRREEAN